MVISAMSFIFISATPGSFSSIADGTATDLFGDDLLGGFQFDARFGCEPLAVALKDLPLVGEVEAGHVYLLLQDILPDIHLGPVGDGEDTEVLAHRLATIEDVPQFRSLVFGVPLSELVAMTEEALFGACLLFVTACSAYGSVEVVLLEGVQEGGGLQLITRSVVAGFFLDTSLVY